MKMNHFRSFSNHSFAIIIKIRNISKIVLLLIAYTGFVMSGCRKNPSPDSLSVEAPIRVKVAPVVRSTMVDTVRIFGKIQLRQETYLASQFKGRLTGFHLLLGDAVRRGERIGTIVPPRREALLQILNKIDTPMRSALEQQIKSIPLYSPIDGTVLEILHHTGDVVQNGQPIVHIGDLRTLNVIGELPVRYLPLMKNLKYIHVSFINYPHPPIKLPLLAISGKVNERKQTVSLRLELKNTTGEYRPGMVVQMVFPGRVHQNTLTILRQALLEEEGLFSAFVLRGNKVEKRFITIGIQQKDRVEVLSGLKAGESVVTRNAYLLTDGMKVVVE